MPTSDSEEWVKRYRQAVLEVDGQKMPERIVAVRQAIDGRLRDLAHDSDHHEERHQIDSALSSLRALEVETREWKSLSFGQGLHATKIKSHKC